MYKGGVDDETQETLGEEREGNEKGGQSEDGGRKMARLGLQATVEGGFEMQVTGDLSANDQ